MTENASDRIPIPDMADLRRRGLAVALLPEYEIGPTRYAGRWWRVSDGAESHGYTPVPVDAIGELDRAKAELDALATFANPSGARTWLPS